jgi:putative membrane protein
MIVRPKLNWLRMLFIWNGSVLNTILPQLLLVLLISSFVTLSHGYVFHYQVELTVAPFTLLGVSMAIFLGFRNSASYDRYWEGRKQWGELLNLTRSLTRQALSLGRLAESDPRLHEWIALLTALCHALRHQLRNSDPAADLDRLVPAHFRQQVLKAHYRPIAILNLLGKWVEERRREGQYGEIIAASFDSNLNGLSGVIGACERLANTPLPYPYAVMNHRIVYLYCFLLPFGLVSTLGYMTPVLSVLVAYTFMALEALAEEIEEPFGTLPNDLALGSICHTIERSLLEMIGKSLAQPTPEPQQYVLL